jgi:hypothetical protein
MMMTIHVIILIYLVTFRIIGKSASLDTLKKVNQGNRDESTGPKLRESSHEYD